MMRLNVCDAIYSFYKERKKKCEFWCFHGGLQEEFPPRSFILTVCDPEATRSKLQPFVLEPVRV